MVTTISQVLTDDELNVIFDYITQTNQIASIEVVFATAAAKKEEPKAEPQAEPQAEKPAQEKADAKPAEQKPARRPKPPRQNPSPRSPLSLSASVSAGWWTPLLSR